LDGDEFRAGHLRFVPDAHLEVRQGRDGGPRRRADGPNELARWREGEYRTIHDQAVKLAGTSSDKALAKRGETRADMIRVYEVLQRGRRGLELSQNLLEGYDVRGLDMSTVRPGHISQQHMDTADGDRHTRLPSDLRLPAAWSTR
jgi:hypothetical protein